MGKVTSISIPDILYKDLIKYAESRGIKNLSNLICECTRKGLIEIQNSDPEPYKIKPKDAS